MNASFGCMRVPFRPAKPRDLGMTMVLDKGMGAAQINDWLSTCGAYVDLVKFGWGTAGVIPEEVLRAKIAALKANGVAVCPGGTFVEIAYVQNNVGVFLERAKELGFTCIEVSDGTVEMPHADKIKLIKQVRQFGFTVVSEVGKKFEVEDQRYSIQTRIDNALSELAAGSVKVIIEARESGSFGIFDKNGEVIPELVEGLVSSVGIHNIIFEAPRVNQQQWLIQNLGNSVNLGNIAPDDTVNLETLRCGLRAGTLKDYHLKSTSVFIEQGVSGALHAASKNDVIVVVDALRCSTTVIAALNAGVTSVKPVVSAEECIGEITAGERGGKKIPTLDYDNSPLSLGDKKLAGKKLVLTTTNGAECIKAASVHGSPVLIGSLVNAKAVAAAALKLAKDGNRNITVVMAGRNNALAVEDQISASEIIANLPGCPLKGYIRPVYTSDYTKDFLESDSGRNLVALGRRDDVIFCAQKDVFDVVPVYRDGVLVKLSS